jgi:hypothetical protein
MTRLCYLVCLLFVAIPLLSQEPEAPKLTITVDLPARLEIDGKDSGTIQPGSPIQLQVTPGEHQIAATPEAGGPAWRKPVLVSSALPTSLSIPLRAHILRADIQKKGYWSDERTGLLWAAADSGSGVTVSQARSYCHQLTAGGFHDWRLPEINEVQTLFGGQPDERGFRVVAPLKLSGWAWSATRGNEAAENWTLDLGDGARASVAAGDAGLNRALCVRSVSR